MSTSLNKVIYFIKKLGLIIYLYIRDTEVLRNTIKMIEVFMQQINKEQDAAVIDIK